MLFRQFRQLSLLITLIVACLQGIVPLLHAHAADPANTNAQSGIHLHEVNAQSLESYAGHSLLPDSTHAMEVGLARQSRDALLLIPILAIFVLLAVSYGLTLHISPWLQRQVHYIPTPRYFSSLLRAPPATLMR